MPFMAYFWISLNFSSFLCRMKAIQYTWQAAAGCMETWGSLAQGNFPAKAAFTFYAFHFPCALSLYSTWWILLAGSCTVHFLCFSQKKSYSCLSSLSPSYHFFSFPLTDIFFLVSPLPLGWNVPTFSFFAESPWGCHPGALNIPAHPPSYHRISASKSSQVMAAKTRVRGGHWILIINKVSQSCIIRLEGTELQLL